MTKPWPTREEWQADAERSVRLACYSTERVSAHVGAYASTAEQDQLRRKAAEARRGFHRIARLLTGPDVNLADISSELSAARHFLRVWVQVEKRREIAAEKAVEAAAEREVARRQTDEAWQRELERRQQIDGGGFPFTAGGAS